MTVADEGVPRDLNEPGAPEDEGFLLLGRLEETSFADLMKSLAKSRETALVILRREGVTKTVYVQDGRIVFASSTEPDDRLGECMLRDGMISVEQYDESGKLIRPGKRQGTILVELGYVTPSELVKGVKCQVEHVVAGLFRWRTGDYRIEIREFDTRDIITLNISTEHLVFSGIKLGAGWSQVLRGLGGSLDSVVDKAPDADTRLYKLDLTDDETHVYSLANGRLTLAQICAMSYVSNYATCLTLWGLTCCGILNVVSSKDAESLFREQVAEFELVEIREMVAAFNAAASPAGARLAAALGEGRRRFLAEALAGVLDEHYDVLREADLERVTLDADLVIENVSAVEPGRRRRLVERALDQLIGALLSKARTEVGPELEQELAAELRPAKRERRS